jgi:hypothetical protein
MAPRSGAGSGARVRLGGFEPPTRGLEGRTGQNAIGRRPARDGACGLTLRRFASSSPGSLHEAVSGRLGHEWGTAFTRSTTLFGSWRTSSGSTRARALPLRARRARRRRDASNALAAAGVTVFELARVMGTSVAMIERHYGALLDGAHNVIASRLDAFEVELEQATENGGSLVTSSDEGSRLRQRFEMHPNDPFCAAKLRR